MLWEAFLVFFATLMGVLIGLMLGLVIGYGYGRVRAEDAYEEDADV